MVVADHQIIINNHKIQNHLQKKTLNQILILLMMKIVQNKMITSLKLLNHHLKVLKMTVNLIIKEKGKNGEFYTGLGIMSIKLVNNI